MYFRYIYGAVFTISSSRRPLRHMHTSSFMSAVRYTPGTSTMTTSQPSCASMVAVINTDYSATVGGVASDFIDPSLFFLPSAHDLPLT
jgi:hypothetical protein